MYRFDAIVNLNNSEFKRLGAVYVYADNRIEAEIKAQQQAEKKYGKEWNGYTISVVSTN